MVYNTATVRNLFQYTNLKVSEIERQTDQYNKRLWDGCVLFFSRILSEAKDAGYDKYFQSGV